jgi:hypothetical protein
MMFASAAARLTAEDPEKLEDAEFHRQDGQRQYHDRRGKGWVIRFSVPSGFSASSAVRLAAIHPRRPRLRGDQRISKRFLTPNDMYACWRDKPGDNVERMRHREAVTPARCLP